MINIVCALHCEAKPLIDYYNMSAVANTVFPMFNNNELSLIVSGVGKTAVASATTYLFVKTQENKNNAWLNYGIAGHKSAKLGRWFNVNKITEKTTNLNWYPARYQSIEIPSLGLKTVDIPQSNYDGNQLYDMEASAFMSTVLKFSSIELIQLMKVVSDNEEQHLDNIDKALVKKLLLDNTDPLIKIIDLLKEKSLIFEKHYGIDECYEACMNQWHFTQYQQKELRRLIQRWKLLKSALPENEMYLLENAKQVLAWFKSQLNNVAVEY